jgi:hypothetical protein
MEETSLSTTVKIAHFNMYICIILTRIWDSAAYIYLPFRAPPVE